jgi:hypothetical protein
VNAHLASRWSAACALVRDFHDVIHGRPTDGAAPAWARERGWDTYLATLSDEELEAGESRGLAAILPRDAPPALRTLVHDVAAVVDLPLRPADGQLPAQAALPRASFRKRQQVSALACAAREVAPAACRVVDAGSGHGHLTRHLSGAMGLPALGIERDMARVVVARGLVKDTPVTFEARAASDGNLGLRAGDLLVGLHACGDLGDDTVKAAAASGAALALVPCCPQKRAGSAVTPWVIPPGFCAEELTLSHGVLGLAGVSTREDLVEAPLAGVMDSRRKRLLVNLLLGMRGVKVAQGEEMRGVNRRRAMATDEELAAQVFALRGLVAPSPGELAHAGTVARAASSATRRYSLPRSMMGRLLEVALVLDRAMFLLQRGRVVRVEQLFPQDVSPRNLVLLSPQ